MKWKPIKIEASPAMREFNDQVEHADFMTDYKHDRESAVLLLARMQSEGCYPNSTEALANAIAGLAVSVKQ